jgi:hypothetical protein
MDWVTRRRGDRVKRIGGLYRQSQFIAEDADKTTSVEGRDVVEN